MKKYKYYLLDNGAGAPYEIYRSNDIDCTEFADAAADLWRAKKNGTWSDRNGDTKLVINLWFKGDFDPEEDEITEGQAMAYLEQWRTGYWPGRE